MTRPLKPWLSLDAQIHRLAERGVQISDRDQAYHALSVVGYYRLSGYWYLYREPNPDQQGRRLDGFMPNTDFAEVWELYNFDRELKTLVLKGIEQVEVAFRSRIGYLLGEQGALAHTDPGHFRSMFDHQGWWQTAQRRIDRARGRDETVDHHDDHYGGEIPVWGLTDLLDFSDLSKLYAGMRSTDQRGLAEIVESLDPKRPDLHQIERVFGTICIIGHLLSPVDPTSQWRTDVEELIDATFPAGGHRSLAEMGFPASMTRRREGQVDC